MITIKGNGGIYEGDSTDTKPSDVAVNTIFHELDTNCQYYYNGEDWAEIPSSGGGGGGGTDNYNELSNKPSINSVTLSGNKTAANLGLQAEITGDVTISSDNVDDTGATNLFVTSSEKSTWNGKQDALTIDSAPTESSTNPVQSGGVYTALSGKQAALAFDGTYNASTNKVATESTVTGAISALDKSSVGLDNVTNNAQVKAVSGSVTSGDIVTFGADGATVQDSGKAIETSLSDSNNKVPTSKAVRDNVAANATLASGYTADSSEASITSATNINDAIEQLDYRTTTNKTNILLLEEMNGKKNVATINSFTYTVGNDAATAYKKIPLSTSLSGEYVIIISNITSDATGNNAWIRFKTTDGTVFDPRAVTKGNNITDNINFGSRVPSELWVYPADSLASSYGKTVTATDIMIIPKSIYDAGFTDYQPYALSNVDLTAAIADLQARVTALGG